MRQERARWCGLLGGLAFGLLGCGTTSLDEPIGKVSQPIVETVQPAKTIPGFLGANPLSSVPYHWETVALAVPPNRAGCGSNGAVFFKPSQTPTPTDQYGWGKIWKASLSCLRGTGGTCNGSVISVGQPTNNFSYKRHTYERGTPPRQQLYYQGGHDARLVRLTDDTLLLNQQGGELSSGGFDVRGSQGYFVSSDCGATWTLRSVLDAKYDFASGAYHNRVNMRGLDYPYMHVDPWRGTVYVYVLGVGDVESGGLLFVSKDNARTWTMVADPVTGLSPIPFAGQRMTTLASGELVLFGCEGSAPTLRIYNPATNQVNLAGDLGGTCSTLTQAQIGGGEPLRDAPRGIIRVISGSNQIVRVMYPTVQNNRQVLQLVDVTISNGSIGGAGITTTIQASSPNGSILHASMIEPDLLDTSPIGSTNPSLVYWLETNTTNPLWGTTATPKAAIFNTDGMSIVNLGPSFDRIVQQGDYITGGFYYDSSQQRVGFVTPWMPDNHGENPFGNLDTLRATTVEWGEPSLTNCATPNGANNVCTSSCLCMEGQADCQSGGCAAGLTCANDVGANYGYASTVDVCVPSACNPNPNPPGSSNFCSATCRCAKGKGDCDSDAQCLPGLVCGRNNGAGFSLSSDVDVCVPTHCTDYVQNGDETSIDRGGSCGNPSCPLPAGGGSPRVGATCRGGLNQGLCDTDKECQPPLVCGGSSNCVCPSTTANGGLVYCSSTCPCAEGRGLCKTNGDCASGLICSGRELGGDVAGLYGMASNKTDSYLVDPVVWNDMKVCVPSTCATQRSTAGAMSTPGHADYCTTQCRCARGFGDCSNNSECLPGLTCTSGLGPNFGLGVDVNVCVPAHCSNAILDGGETFKDCGGPDCGSCDRPISHQVSGPTVVRPLTMFRRTTGEWLEGAFPATGFTSQIRPSNAPRSATPVYGDFDGFSTLDRGYYTPGSNFVYYSGSSTTPTMSPVVTPTTFVQTAGRYKSPGITFDVGWWNTSNQNWFANDAVSGANVLPFASFWWGEPGDIPVPGDYDGDGRFDYAIFRPSTGQWFIRNTNGAVVWDDGTGPQVWGGPGDIPVPGDYNGDGRHDLALYTPGTVPALLEQGFGSAYGRFKIMCKVLSTVESFEIEWGQHGDEPVGGDFNQDGRSDLCVRAKNNSQWFCRDIPNSWSGFKVYGEPRPLWPPQ